MTADEASDVYNIQISAIVSATSLLYRNLNQVRLGLTDHKRHCYRSVNSFMLNSPIPSKIVTNESIFKDSSIVSATTLLNRTLNRIRLGITDHKRTCYRRVKSFMLNSPIIAKIVTN